MVHRALAETWKRVLGPEHPATLLPVYNLAICLANQGMRDDGLAMAQRAWQGRKKCFEESNIDTVQALKLCESLAVAR